MSTKETIVINAMRELRLRHASGDCPSKLRFCQLNGLDRKIMIKSSSRTMTADTMLKLCNAIGCTPNDLLRGLY